MEKKVFRVGSVGIGGISRGVHLPGIHKSPDLELVAVCDLKPERMEYARNTSVSYTHLTLPTNSRG